MPDNRKLVEITQAVELFVCGLGRIEIIHGNVRITWFTEQTGPDGEPECAVNLRTIMPLDALWPAIEALINARGMTTPRPLPIALTG